MAELKDKNELISSSFRRASLTPTAGPGALGKTVIETDRIEEILSQLGQAYDQKEVQAYIRKIDADNTGLFDFAQFQCLCDVFLKDPAALAKYQGDEFSFKHLIRPQDFPN